MLDNDSRKKVLILLIIAVLVSAGLLFYLSRSINNGPAEDNSEENSIIVPESEAGENGLPAGIKVPANTKPTVVNSGTNSTGGLNTLNNNNAGINNPSAVNNVGQKEYGLPVRIKIPMIGVDAAVEYVGITNAGEMGVPAGPYGVAWYQLGTRPGEEGSAVMTGHYGTWRDGSGSVFDNLNKIKAGDKIYIEDSKGNIIIFIVRERRDYNPDADTAEIFTSDDGKSHLNLITCEGVWNKASQSFSQRLVVFSDKQ